jgi:3-phenylpropionate/cinnamic acid dioxygenase small subunit
MAHAEKPPSVTRRLITNVEVLGDDGPGIAVLSNFVAYQARLDIDEFTFYGYRDDLLRRADDELQLVRRIAVVDQFVLARSLTILF